MKANASREVGGPRGTSCFGVLYDLFIRSQATRARLGSLLALGALGMVIGAAIGSSDPVDPTSAGAYFVDTFGLSLVVPVTTLVFASAVFGDIREDGSMVYLWLRPVPARVTVAASYLATLTVVLPVVVIPLTIATALTSGGDDLVIGTAVAASIGVVSYGAVFLALGLRVQRALVWGLIYILLWEGFVTQAASTPGRMALHTYTSSALAHVAGTDAGDVGTNFATALAVPVLVVLVALIYASRRFRRQDVA